MASALDNYYQGMNNRSRIDQQIIQAEGATILSGQVGALSAQVSALSRELKDERMLREQAEDDADYYRNLLSKPMAEIAAENGDFKQAYEKQQEILAEWMVSQKAFKELAFQLGAQLGMAPGEVFKKGEDMQMAVLNNENEPGHKTNISDSKTIEPFAEKLKQKHRTRNGK